MQGIEAPPPGKAVPVLRSAQAWLSRFSQTKNMRLHIYFPSRSGRFFYAETHMVRHSLRSASSRSARFSNLMPVLPSDMTLESYGTQLFFFPLKQPAAARLSFLSCR